MTSAAINVGGRYCVMRVLFISNQLTVAKKPWNNGKKLLMVASKMYPRSGATSF